MSDDKVERWEHFGNGALLRRKSIKNKHACSTPGFFSRLWNGVKEGDKWRCNCGQIWKWEGCYDFCYWGKTDH